MIFVSSYDKQNEMSYENNPLHVNTTERRFEMNVDRHTAFINYKQGGKKVYLIHTEVSSEIEGKGVATSLVEKTLQYLDEHQLKLVPLCAFVQSYVQKHPEWKRLEVKEKE